MKKKKKAAKETLTRMNMLAVAWRHESGLGNSRDGDIQVNGQHCPWPHQPPREMAARMTQSGAAPVVGTMAFASCSNRIYRLFSYQTYWISSPTPFPAFGLHWEIQSMTQHWGLTLRLERKGHQHDFAFQGSGFLANSYSFLSSPSREKNNFRKSCQSRVQERKL